MRKLYIYDKSSNIDRSQADGRFGPGDDVVTAAVESTEQLTSELKRLASLSATFDRVLFQTHGNKGMIFFGDTAVKADDFSGIVDGSEVMFPTWTRVYFDGCNVADGDEGWVFLEAVGKALLKKAGGAAYGWTSAGIGLPGWIPFIGGHTGHPFGDVRLVSFGAGGIPLKRVSV